MTSDQNRIINIMEHPHDPASILSWALGIWESDPHASLLVITALGDGQNLDNRLRVKLSIVRNQLKNQHGQSSKRFSILSKVIPWATDTRGEQRCEALCLAYVVRGSHVARDAFDKIFTEKLG